MRTLVDSLQRLYSLGKLTVEKLNNLLIDNKITQEEYDYIISTV